MKVSEIFYSIQGESTLVGIPTTFIRFAGCNVSPPCPWCDTKYALGEGKEMGVIEIMEQVKKFDCNYVCITGGEPLLQRKELMVLSEHIWMWKPHTVISVETNGTLPLRETITSSEELRILKDLKFIMDVKCPSSGVVLDEKEMRYRIQNLYESDEIKFVIASGKDYEFAKHYIKKVIPHNLIWRQRNIMFAPVVGMLKPRILAGWILEDNLPVRMQVQLHKVIWPDKEKGY